MFLDDRKDQHNGIGFSWKAISNFDQTEPTERRWCVFLSWVILSFQSMTQLTRIDSIRLGI